MSAFGKQRALLHQAGTYHGQGGALGEHMAPLGEPSGCPLLALIDFTCPRACYHTNPDAVQQTTVNSSRHNVFDEGHLSRIRGMLEDIVEDNQDGRPEFEKCFCAEQSLARKVVARFGSSWTSMQAVLCLPCPGIAELREIAARCCTLAMRADRSAQPLEPTHHSLHHGGLHSPEPHSCMRPAPRDKAEDGIGVSLAAEP